MKLYALRHKTKKKQFLHVANDGRGNPAYQLRLVHGRVPQLHVNPLSHMLSLWRQPGWMSPADLEEVKTQYESVAVALTFPND